jgi:uncharacterized glyoxalase superfamily protein PhnB
MRRTEEMMSLAWKPAGYSSVSPYLITPNAQRVIDFLIATCGATALRRYENADGSIMHAEVDVDGSVVMLGEAGEEWPAVPCHLHVYVPDVDATYRLALQNGGTPVQAPTQREGDPDRRGGVLGPGGNTWWFSTQKAADA